MLEDDAVMLGTSGLASPSAPRDRLLSEMCPPPGGRVLTLKRSRMGAGWDSRLPEVEGDEHTPSGVGGAGVGDLVSELPFLACAPDRRIWKALIILPSGTPPHDRTRSSPQTRQAGHQATICTGRPRLT